MMGSVSIVVCRRPPGALGRSGVLTKDNFGNVHSHRKHW
jgi:hypothetical protein